MIINGWRILDLFQIKICILKVQRFIFMLALTASKIRYKISEYEVI